MTIQAASFAPDVQFFLDSALEYGELDGGSHIALRLYAMRSEVMAIIDNVPPVGEYLSSGRPYSRLATTARLADLADRLLADLSIERRGAVAWAGIEHLRTEIESLAWCCAVWAIEDEIKGGCLKPYRRRQSRTQQRYEVSPKLHRRLYGRNWVRRYVKTNEDCRKLRAKARRLIERMRGVDRNAVRTAAGVLMRDMAQQREQHQRINDHLLRVFIGKSVDPGIERRTRSVIKRAASTAVAVVGRQLVSDFAAGRLVRIKGDTIDLEVGRVGSSAMIGHMGLHVTAVSPLTGERLADLCVYHEATPVLDQLTALSLSMQAGEEAEILATANLSRVTDAGRAHPLIQDRGISQQARRPRDEVREKNENYWLDTKRMWIDTLGVFVLGRLWQATERATQ